MNQPSNAPICYQYYASPCGPLLLASVGESLCLCDWAEGPMARRNRQRLLRSLGGEWREAPSAVIRCATKQLDEYFMGQRKAFSLPLRFVGTDFQQRVWRVLLDVGYGSTCSYKDIAHRVGCERGVRAVAQAIGASAISILCPCHRVVGANHTLTGYAGGLEAKRWLLKLENAVVK